MSSLSRSLTVPAPPARVADYLSDLANAVEWDPHTIACARADEGPVRLGARYEHTREFAGHRVTTPAEVVEYVPRSCVAWAGGNDLAQGREQFVFEAAAAGGTTVIHTVDIDLHGVARIGRHMLPAVIRRIADDGDGALRASLARLAT